MKFTIEQPALLSAMNAICEVVGKRTTIPVLAHVMIRAEPAGLSFVGTDLDNELTIQAAATIQKRGTMLAPAFVLRDIAAAVNGPVTFELGKDGLLICCGACTFKVSTMSKDDFPTLAKPKNGTAFALPVALLRDAISTVRHAISTEETRFYLNGICLRPNGESLYFAATNGHLLAEQKIPMPRGAEKMATSIVPHQAVKTFLAATAAVEGDVSIEVQDVKIRLRWDGGELAAKLIDGTFPDYERVIPKESVTVGVFPVSALIPAITRMKAICGDQRAISLKLGGNSVELSGNNPERGRVSERIGGTLTGPGLEIGFNPRYLEQTLRLDGDVSFLLIDSASPARFEFSGRPDCRFVLMPMRL